MLIVIQIRGCFKIFTNYTVLKVNNCICWLTGYIPKKLGYWLYDNNPLLFHY
jgi:hypothetical protein